MKNKNHNEKIESRIEKKTNEENEHKSYFRVVLGVLIVLFGILVLLSMIGYVNFSVLFAISKFWPIGIILIGLALIFRIKGVTGVLVLLTIFLLALYVIDLTNVTHSIKGSGNIITKEVPINDFSGVELNVPAEVHLIQSDNYSVKLIGDDNIINVLDIKNKDKSLSIGFVKDYYFWNILTNKPLKIYISSPNFEKISMNNPGSIVTDNQIITSKIEATISGAGNIDLDVKTDDLTSRISGFGDMNLKGYAKRSDVSVTGAGSINAYSLSVEDAKVMISGAGDAKMNVSKSLDGKISGAGTIKYLGDPVVKSSISGAGDIKRILNP